MSVIPYRKDIDGLRAVAVLLVVFSHAQFPLFEGGFVGVDVFFVISGYLITSIMVNEIDQGVFSFKIFYLRRIRRLLPALLVVLGGTTYVAHKLLLPGLLLSYAKAQFATLASCSNFFLWRYFGGYWRGYSKEFPLTHTWSLSVEEQFYYLWPAFLLLAYRFIPKKFHARILFSVFILLLLLSQYLVKFPEFAFYMIPARFFEMFLGAMGALLFRKPIALDPIIEKKTVNFVHITGLSLILYASFFYKEGLPYPGLDAFIPCLGTFLLLLPFRWSASPIANLFSTSIFRGMGKISYSLYLWHWPVFSLLAYTGHSVVKYRIPALCLSLGLSVLSYKLIEKPFRKANISFKAAFCSFVLLPICLSGIYLYGAYNDDGYMTRYTEDERKAIHAVSSIERPYLGAQLGKGSPTDSHIENANSMWNMDSSGPVQALLLGDSHSTAIRPFVELICAPYAIKGLQVARDSTPFLLNVDFYDRDVQGNLELRADKREMNEYWRKLVTQGKVKYVFIAAFYSSRIYSNANKPERMLHENVEPSSDIISDNKVSFELGLYDAIKFLVKNGVTPVLFKDIPYVREPLSQNYVKNILFNSDLHTSANWNDIEKRHSFEDSVIDKIKLEYPSVIVIDPKDLLKRLTKNGQFNPVLDGVPLYADSNHLNYDGAVALGKAWLDAFGNPLEVN
ncbi:acyltransferase family protein [Maridesulfovibrio salexigens]|uniref:Acyltransferase 3 n=1 Tax=Maridesulfovibrio salexigens (strain ATCC 14822 / DSM 2638 / NCIMB 8403 / VKM B-1763) TaxID=526222 RepID=C6BTY1_MARSD|nr:acyltransferase family protein [Maridesulfovibrio salexigens]ACS81690.1 acyltransferase 3 [Maridesulfovibrio salexigens DSM 2638]